MKDKLARLAPAIEREMREAAMRRERRIAEQEVQYTRQYLASVFNSLSSVLITATGQGVVTQWNAAAEKYAGVPAEYAIGRDIIQVLPWFAGFKQHISDVISTHIPHRFKTVQECSFGNVYFDVTLFPLDIEHSSDIVIRMDDVTELELKEQQLRQAQKMEIVGMLAGGLAHDFNNVLCGITGSLSVLRSKLKAASTIPYDQLELFLDLMQNAGSRAVDLVKQLLSLSRKKECLVVSFDLNKAVRQAIELCRNTFDRCVEIRAVLPEKNAMVSADPTQIEQVVLNLLVNAFHAMTIMRPAGQQAQGVLTLSVGKAAAGEPPLQQSAPMLRPGSYWKLRLPIRASAWTAGCLIKYSILFLRPRGLNRARASGLPWWRILSSSMEGLSTCSRSPGPERHLTCICLRLRRRRHRCKAQPPEPVPRGEGLVLIADDDADDAQGAEGDS